MSLRDSPQQWQNELWYYKEKHMTNQSHRILIIVAQGYVYITCHVESVYGSR